MVNNDGKITQTSIGESSINFDEINDLAHRLKTLNQAGYMLCYNCHKIIPSDSEYCPFCGNLLFITCPKCGHRHSSEYPICNKCGTYRKTYIVEQKRLEQQEVEEQRRRSEQQRIEEQRRRDAEEKRRQEELRQLEEKRCREEAEARRLAEERRRLELKEREDRKQRDARIIWEGLTGSVDGTKISTLTLLSTGYMPREVNNIVGSRKRISYRNIVPMSYYEGAETLLRDVIVPCGVKCLDGFSTYKELRLKVGRDAGGISNKISSMLQNIEIPSSVTSIGNYAFRNCKSLQNVTIPESVISIGSYAFAGCSDFTTIEIPDSVKSLGEGAFTRCPQLVSFKSDTFCPCGERYLIAGDTLVTIAPSGIDSIEIPDIVKRIGAAAFEGCSFVKRICIPDGVESFGMMAFYGCTSLCDIVIPSSVKSIGPDAFDGCTELRKIIVPKGFREHFISILPEWIQNQIQIEEE